jgi:hypothetical protein
LHKRLAPDGCAPGWNDQDRLHPTGHTALR